MRHAARPRFDDWIVSDFQKQKAQPSKLGFLLGHHFMDYIFITIGEI